MERLILKYPEEKSSSKEKCDTTLSDIKVDPFVFVIFGGAGDYTKRMLMPSLYHLFHDGVLPQDFTIIGFGLPEMSDGQYRDYLKASLEAYSKIPVGDNAWETYRAHISYISADFSNPGGFQRLVEKINDTCALNAEQKKEAIFYFAVPPAAAPAIIRNLQKNRLCEGSIEPKMVMEKPFGSDRASAAKLNSAILGVFKEHQIYRVDHYLGKETVQNIMFFRFANSIFEPLWNRRYIDHVEISVAEQLGIEHRGAFYEEAGVVRDVFQNHMMQLIALVAMEPPVGFNADLIRDEKVKVFRTIRKMDETYIDDYIVRGQYGPGEVDGQSVQGYRQEDGVAQDSNTPTFFAAKLYIDNWRWAGVPFYVRTGKRLKKRATAISIFFKQPPLTLFGKACDIMRPNSLRLGIQPHEDITLCMSVKYPGIGNQPYNVTMDFDYEKTFEFERHTAHERLILDCLRGDLTLFARQDGVEAMWGIVDPIIARWEKISPAFPNYPAGNRGPPEADALMARDGCSWSAL
jgi:glucose-6-phosphate 1-dehydrogenase